MGVASNPNPALTPTQTNPGNQTTPVGVAVNLQLEPPILTVTA